MKKIDETQDETIKKLSRKLDQLDALQRQLQQRKKETERKARTRRLIHIGAEVESVYGKPIWDDDLPKLRKFLMDQEARGKFFSRAMEKEKGEEICGSDRTVWKESFTEAGQLEGADSDSGGSSENSPKA